MQFHGAKRVILFPPSQLYNLYPFSLFKQLIHGPKLRAGHSRVYPDQPDFDQFPRLQEALNHRYDVLLERGDALYTPEDVTCSVNRFWHVPLGRGLTSWSKWRVHLGSLLAIPHLLKELIKALVSGDRPQKLHQWRLKL
ncbi:cupin-like domain-containing protein [Spirulina sp. CCNP1310]|uniref:cupin-like domain-containing protein n=1 Tax=Spirulina sp. CCNP1310 TaxID=3110249 RepID=UPI002B20329B|nr:cupin-like domain-containing protein [Spirulina sp. CCNP1310]MEA5420388.1 cupin-like domain-containing protein [Spirulina sp. CCNP1310]